MNHAELVMRRRNVWAFIQADPVKIELKHDPEPTKTASGGLVKGPAITRAPQIARIVQNVRRYDNGLINSEAGYIPNTMYLLIARHNFLVEVNDTFLWLNNHWRVSGIHPTRSESLLCSLDFLGETNVRPE